MLLHRFCLFAVVLFSILAACTTDPPSAPTAVPADATSVSTFTPSPTHTRAPTVTPPATATAAPAPTSTTVPTATPSTTATAVIIPNLNSRSHGDGDPDTRAYRHIDSCSHGDTVTRPHGDGCVRIGRRPSPDPGRLPGGQETALLQHIGENETLFGRRGIPRVSGVPRRLCQHRPARSRLDSVWGDGVHGARTGVQVRLELDINCVRQTKPEAGTWNYQPHVSWIRADNLGRFMAPLPFVSLRTQGLTWTVTLESEGDTVLSSSTFPNGMHIVVHIQHGTHLVEREEYVFGTDISGVVTYEYGKVDSFDVHTDRDDCKLRNAATLAEQERQRADNIDRRVNGATLDDLIDGLTEEALQAVWDNIVRQYPNASDERRRQILETYLRDRWRLTLELLDACRYGVNSLIGEPDISEEVRESTRANYEQQHGYPCRFLSDGGGS